METITAQSKGIFIPNDAKKHLNEGITTILKNSLSANAFTEIYNQTKITVDNTMDSDKNNTNSKRDAKKRCVQYMYTSQHSSYFHVIYRVSTW